MDKVLVTGGSGFIALHCIDQLLEKGYRMDRGYGSLRGKVFRISHMGNIFPKDLNEYLENFTECINV